MPKVSQLVALMVLGIVSACAAPATFRGTVDPAECHYALPNSTHIYAEAEVDDPPQLLGHDIDMVYPPAMRARGKSGHVFTHYVIDSLGVAVISSILIDSATHPDFIPAAQDVIAHSRFSPALRQGQLVAVCVKQTFNWTFS